MQPDTNKETNTEDSVTSINAQAPFNNAYEVSATPAGPDDVSRLDNSYDVPARPMEQGPTPLQPVVVDSYNQITPIEPAVIAQRDTTSAAIFGVNPQPVMQVLSPRGVEYVFLTISLFTAAIGLTSGLLASLNGQIKYTTLSFPSALLIVGLPIFGWLFLRLKKAELREPSAALDASKRRSTQSIQIITFVVTLFSLIGLVAAIFAKMGGQLSTSLGKIVLDILVLLIIFGGILAYYWHDEHRGI
jgi:hypothetical protein